MFEEELEKEKEHKPNIFQRVSEEPTILENVRTIMIIVIAFILPILYWGYVDGFNFVSLLTWNIGALAIITLFNSSMLWVEIGIKAEKHAYLLTDKLKKLSEDNNNKKEILSKHIDKIIEFIDDYNECEQEKANKLLKEKKIKKIENKINKYKIKSKSRKIFKRIGKLNRLQSKLIVVKESEYYAWRRWNGKRYYKPIKIGKVLSHESVDSIVITGQDSILYNPKRDGAVRWFILSFLKHMGIGVSGSLPFIINESAKNIAIFYGLMTMALLTTSISRYIKIRFKSLNKMITTNMNMNLLLDKMINYVNSKESVVSE